MIRALAIGLMAATAVSSAMAADLIVEEPIAEVALAAFDWSGFYVGAHAGFAAGEVTADPLDTPFGPSSASGWLLGVQAGANAQFDTFVLGVEGDVAWSDINNDEDITDGPWDADVDVNWLTSLRGRAGVAVDQVLLYATAGVAGAGIDFLDQENGTAVSGTHFGWTAGVGAEVALTESVSAKIEYLYYDFGPETYETVVPDDVSFTLHTVKAGVNFHF